MNRTQFVINREHQAARCDICHQSDCFNAESGSCTRCQTVILSMPVITAEEKPFIVEAYAQMTSLQVILTLLIGGMITGWFIDITKLKTELSNSVAIVISLSAALPLVANRARQLHPFFSGLLATLTIAPLGWPILNALYWLAMLLS